MNLRLICFHPHHYVKSVSIWSYSGPHFLAFRLNTERYTASLRIQSKCGNMRTRITNTENFNTVHLLSAWCLLKGHTHLTKSAGENVNYLLAKINLQLNTNSTSFQHFVLRILSYICRKTSAITSYYMRHICIGLHTNVFKPDSFCKHLVNSCE